MWKVGSVEKEPTVTPPPKKLINIIVWIFLSEINNNWAGKCKHCLWLFVDSAKILSKKAPLI